MPIEPAAPDEQPLDGELAPEPASEAEGAEVRHLPVVADGVARPVGPDSASTELEPYRPLAPAAIVAAAGGFLAGVAAFFIVRVLRRKPSSALGARRGALGRRRKNQLPEIAASKSFLVDIHLLKR
jgi:hypothetical protein